MDKDYLNNGNFNKFTVIKNEDIRRYLDDNEQNEFNTLRYEINSGRFNDSKPMNKYIVINTDEEYAPEVIEILKRHGHWG